jgi:hypothetical protein
VVATAAAASRASRGTNADAMPVDAIDAELKVADDDDGDDVRATTSRKPRRKARSTSRVINNVNVRRECERECHCARDMYDRRCRRVVCLHEIVNTSGATMV